MNIFILAAGQSKRFVNAGYQTPKHLLIYDKTRNIIQYLVEEYSGDDDMIVVATSKENSKSTTQYLSKYKNCYVVSLPKTISPLDTLKKMTELVRPCGDVLITYCDIIPREGEGARIKEFFEHFTKFPEDSAHSFPFISLVKSSKKRLGKYDDEYRYSGIYYFPDAKEMENALDRTIFIRGKGVKDIMSKICGQDNIKIIDLTSAIVDVGVPEDYKEFMREQKK